MSINLNDSDLFESIAFAGASTYPWYARFNIDEEGQKLDVLIDCEGVREGATLTPGSLRRSFEALIDGEKVSVTGGSVLSDYDWSDPECDSDIDADIADLVIQNAVLGEVVFG